MTPVRKSAQAPDSGPGATRTDRRPSGERKWKITTNTYIFAGIGAVILGGLAFAALGGIPNTIAAAVVGALAGGALGLFFLFFNRCGRIWPARNRAETPTEAYASISLACKGDIVRLGVIAASFLLDSRAADSVMEVELRDETKCFSCVGWSYEDKLLHIAPSGAQCRLLSSYKLSLDRGVEAVRRLILADVARFQEMGAQKYADDLKVVLACFAAECMRDASDCREKPAAQ